MSTKKFEYTILFRGYVLNVRQTTFLEKLPKNECGISHVSC